MSAATVQAVSPPAPRLPGMVWVTWRQHRVALAGVVATLGGFGLLMVWNGIAMHRAYTRLGVAACMRNSSCEVPYSLFLSQYQSLAQFLPRYLAFLPGVIGVFTGAPLVAREFESGTFRFAWTQGTSRVRWITAKLALLSGLLVLLALAFSWLFAWWFGPFHAIMGRMGTGQAYETEGVVFAARTLFGFTLGAFLGAVIRRAVPAMAATGAVWLAVVWPSTIYLRALIQPAEVVSDQEYIGIDKTWTISSWVQDPAGHHLNRSQLQSLFNQARGTGVTTDDAFNRWLTAHHYSQWDSYQPDSRFWHFQVVEGSAYVVLAILLSAATVWLLRRRAT